MKYIDEYRDPRRAEALLRAIKEIAAGSWTIMEVCGGQTHSILRFGIDQLLPAQVQLLHGPGCPVCVTPLAILDQAIDISSRQGVIFCSFGDMLRVPGSSQDLLSAKAAGADVRIVYSPLDALKIAQEHPEREVVFFAVGFETTAPANAMAVYQAHRLALRNFSILSSQVLVPPAMELILSSPGCRVQGFLAAGHVCTVTGYELYEPLVHRFKVPIVVTGFEPLDLLQGVYLCIKQLEEGRHAVENQYSRSVRSGGNARALEVMTRVFEIVPREWRGIGVIAQSGLGLRPEYEAFDASKKFPPSIAAGSRREAAGCISGEILQGFKRPPECPQFGRGCTPEKPLGATMVSGEGACAAYYRYRKNNG